MASVAATDLRDLAFAGVARQAELVRSKEVSPRELVELSLGRIARLDPELNAFRTVFAERALTEADQAGARAAAGDDRPLLGVPIAIKEEQAVGGTPLTWGSNGHGGPEREDCELVRQLRAAGAIVIGTTRTPELMIMPFTESAAGGFTRNPWDPQRTPGGSSGGSAAAVAAGLVPAATASDGGGSIRIPAACCNLFGLKPQWGRVTWAPSTLSWHGLSVPGFLAASVADTALLYEVVTGLPYVAAARREPGRLRIAVSVKTPPGLIASVEPQRRAAVEGTAELLRSLGHDVVERELDYGLTMAAHFMVRWLTGIHEAAGTMAHPERLARRSKGLVRLGGALRPLLRRVRAAEGATAARINAIFDDVDVVLGPTLTGPPLPVGRYEGRGALRTIDGISRFMPHNPVWNHLGNPAAAVPAGFDREGLPLSVQIAGRPDGEETLFSLAGQLEAARPWADRRPPLS